MLLRLAVAGLIALCLSAAAAPAQEAPPAPPQKVDGPEISTLIRMAIVALDQANATGNYTVLRDLGAGAMQAANSAADLAKLFADYRENHVSLAGTVVFDPILDDKPQLSTDGALHLVGHFPTRPQEVMFDLMFFFENGRWRIANMRVGTRLPPGEGTATAKPGAATNPVPLPRQRPKS